MARNHGNLRRMNDTSSLLDLEIGKRIGEIRAPRMSARALAARCEDLGLKLDRNRVADIELARRRPISVTEWLGLAYALRTWPSTLLLGEPPATKPGAAALADRRFQAWAEGRVAIAERLTIPRGDLDGWLNGTWPAWGDEPDAEVDPTLSREPEVPLQDAMSIIRTLAATHGLRVTFEPIDGAMGEHLRERSRGKR